MRQPLFIIIDLDGTLVHEGSRQLMFGVEKKLRELKKEGNFLSVCSNNILAKEILAELQILELFDYVLGRSSASFKSVEFLECWAFYRYLYRTKQVRWKVHLNRIIFVDNDLENLQELSQRIGCITLFSSVAELSDAIPTFSKPVGGTIEIAKRNVKYEHGKTIPRPSTPQVNKVIVYISELARTKYTSGTRNMRFHTISTCGALLRCRKFKSVTESEMIESGHTVCKICDYNRQFQQTNKFCIQVSSSTKPASLPT